MKESELKRKLAVIGKRLEKSGLLWKCEKIALELGEKHVSQGSCNTKIEATYSDKDLVVYYGTGYSMFGGGAIRVTLTYEPFLVLNCSEIDGPEKDEICVKSADPAYKCNQNYKVSSYLPGDWRKRINYLYSHIEAIKDKKAKAETSLVDMRFKVPDSDVSSEKLRKLEERFGKL